MGNLTSQVKCTNTEIDLLTEWICGAHNVTFYVGRAAYLNPFQEDVHGLVPCVRDGEKVKLTFFLLERIEFTISF